jgi:hypothetical protein
MDTLVIAKGELCLHRAGRAAVQLTSAFAREVVERDERSRRNPSWKHAPRERGQQTGVIPANALWGSQQSVPLAPPKFLLACFGADTDTVYSVQRVGEAIGLFRQHLAESREVRLFHRSDTVAAVGHAAPRAGAKLGIGRHELVDTVVTR